MKKLHPLFICILAGALLAPTLRAGTLDDLIATLRRGDKLPASQLGMNLIKQLRDEPGAPGKAFTEAVVNLYLHEIKLSIVDPESNGGWPVRSFLIENDLSLRRSLTEGMTTRFNTSPDPVLAFALVCPALYAKDDALAARAESYLKENDAFLYKIEQDQASQYWRPAIANILKAQTGGK